MKLTKRIIALTIVLCTLGAMMIPGVSAAEPASIAPNFKESAETAGYDMSANRNVTATLNTDALTAFNNSYAANGWTLYTDATGAVVGNATKYTLSKGGTEGGWQINCAKAADASAYLALKFKAPGTGEYSFGARFDLVSNSTKAGVYILDMPATPYTIDTLPKVDATFTPPAEAKISLETSYYEDGSVEKGDFFSGDKTVSLVEGKEYILVLWHGTHKTNAPAGTPYGLFSWFSLTYEGPTQEEDTTVYEAAIGDTKYETFAAAVEAANAAEDDVTIKVLTDITTATGEINLNSNVTLDLNGKAVNGGTNKTAFTGKLTDSTGGDGFLRAANASVITTAADEFAIWDQLTAENVIGANGWRVYKYSFETAGAKDTSAEGVVSSSFWATLKFNNAAAYDRIVRNGLVANVGFDVQWTPAEGEASEVKQYLFASADMITWATEQKATEDILSFFINVTGFEKIEEAGTLTVTPVVKRGDKVKTASYAEAMTYIVE